MAVKGRKRTAADYRRMEESVKAGRVFTAPLRYNYFESESTGQTENNPYANSRYLPPDAAGTGERRYAPEVNNSLLYGNGGSADQNQNAFGHTAGNPLLAGNPFVIADPETNTNFLSDNPDIDEQRSAMLGIPIDQLTPLPGTDRYDRVQSEHSAARAEYRANDYWTKEDEQRLKELRNQMQKINRQQMPAGASGAVMVQNMKAAVNDFEPDPSTYTDEENRLYGEYADLLARRDPDDRDATMWSVPIDPRLSSNNLEPLYAPFLLGAADTVEGWYNAAVDLFSGTQIKKNTADSLLMFAENTDEPVLKAQYTKDAQKLLNEVSEEVNSRPYSTSVDKLIQRSAENYQLNPVYQTLSDASGAIGSMLPHIAVNAVLPGSSVPSIGASVYGGKTAEMVAEGYDIETARLAGLAYAGAEAIPEVLFGGIGGLGNGIADDWLTGAIKKFVSGETGQLIAKRGLNIAGEVLEEEITRLAESFIPMIYDEAAGEGGIEGALNEYTQNMFSDFLTTGLVSLITNAPSDISAISRMNRTPVLTPNVPDFYTYNPIDRELDADGGTPNDARVSVNTLNPAKNPAPDPEAARLDLYRRMFGSGDTGGEVQTENGGVPAAITKGGIQDADVRSGVQTENGVPIAVLKGGIQDADVRSGVQAVTGDADRFFLRLHGIDPDTGLEGPVKTPNAYSDTAGESGIVEIPITQKPNQIHHYATNKNKAYTPLFNEITKKYDLNIDGGWNKGVLPHQGRHPDAYHDYVLKHMKQCDRMANGNREIFTRLYEDFKNKIKNNPEMLYRDYWTKRQEVFR